MLTACFFTGYYHFFTASGVFEQVAQLSEALAGTSIHIGGVVSSQGNESWHVDISIQKRQISSVPSSRNT